MTITLNEKELQNVDNLIWAAKVISDKMHGFAVVTAQDVSRLDMAIHALEGEKEAA